MRITIKQLGNSFATRIPKAVANSIGLHLNQAVNIEAVNGNIIITPIKKKEEYKLEGLLSQTQNKRKKMGEMLLSLAGKEHAASDADHEIEAGRFDDRA